MSPKFDPSHFCPSWCDCCQANLDLKPKHPEIKKGMTLDDAMKVIEAVIQVWHSVCAKDTHTFEVCLKAFIPTEELGDILIKALTNCKCCIRHSVHKPNSIRDVQWHKHVVPLRDQGAYDPEEICYCVDYRKLKERCECECRHFSRLVQDIIIGTR